QSAFDQADERRRESGARAGLAQAEPMLQAQLAQPTCVLLLLTAGDAGTLRGRRLPERETDSRHIEPLHVAQVAHAPQLLNVADREATVASGGAYGLDQAFALPRTQRGCANADHARGLGDPDLQGGVLGGGNHAASDLPRWSQMVPTTRSLTLRQCTSAR